MVGNLNSGRSYLITSVTKHFDILILHETQQLWALQPIRKTGATKRIRWRRISTVLTGGPHQKAPSLHSIMLACAISNFQSLHFRGNLDTRSECNFHNPNARVHMHSGIFFSFNFFFFFPFVPIIPVQINLSGFISCKYFQGERWRQKMKWSEIFLRVKINVNINNLPIFSNLSVENVQILQVCWL